MIIITKSISIIMICHKKKQIYIVIIITFIIIITITIILTLTVMYSLFITGSPIIVFALIAFTTSCGYTNMTCARSVAEWHFIREIYKTVIVIVTTKVTVMKLVIIIHTHVDRVYLLVIISSSLLYHYHYSTTIK